MPRPHLHGCCASLDFVVLICPKVLNINADIYVILSSKFCTGSVRHENLNKNKTQ